MLYSTIFPSKINFILLSYLMFYKNTTIQYCVSSKNYADCNKCLKFHKMFSNSSIRNRNIALFLVIAVCSPIFQHLEIYCIVCSLHLEDNFPLDIQESRQDCLVVHSSSFLAIRNDIKRGKAALVPRSTSSI